MIFDAIKRWLGYGSSQNGEGGESPGEMISCEAALSRVYEFLDGELDSASHEEVERHFEVCTRCYPHLASEQSFRRALRRAIDGRGAPEGLRTRILDLLGEEEVQEDV